MKEMTSHTIKNCCEPVWLAIVRAYSTPHYTQDVSRHACGCRQDTVGNGTRQFPFYCGSRSIAAFLALISTVVYRLFSVSSNRLITFIQMLRNCSIRLTRMFQSDRTTSFKLWHSFIMYKNPSMKHCYNRSKIFAFEMQQKFWPSDKESLFLCTYWMCSFDVQELSLFIHGTPIFNHLYVRFNCFWIRNFITIGQSLLGESLF